VAYECEVITHVKASPDTVWDWMSDVRRLLTVNLFHEDVIADEPVTGPGPRIPVPHSMFGVIKQERVVHVRDYRRYFIGFGETKARHVPGVDPFPHYQSFEVVPLQDGTCLVVNHLRGLYQFPGAKTFGERIFRRWTPVILEHDNASIAIAVGALDEAEKPKLKGGLLLWPFMTLGGRFINQSQRRKIVSAHRKSATPREQATVEQAGSAAASSGER
jgi:hypothetical protein